MLKILEKFQTIFRQKLIYLKDSPYFSDSNDMDNIEKYWKM